MAISITTDSATITTSEYFLFSDSTTKVDQTTDGIIQVYLDLADMVAGDQLEIKFYEKVNDGTTTPFYTATLSGAQTPSVWVSPAFALGVGYEVSLDCLAGTSIVVDWNLVRIT